MALLDRLYTRYDKDINACKTSVGFDMILML
jgi:hypothetical protein